MHILVNVEYDKFCHILTKTSTLRSVTRIRLWALKSSICCAHFPGIKLNLLSYTLFIIDAQFLVFQ